MKPSETTEISHEMLTETETQAREFIETNFPDRPEDERELAILITTLSWLLAEGDKQ